jgi:hypothetical protein
MIAQTTLLFLAVLILIIEIRPAVAMESVRHALAFQLGVDSVQAPSGARARTRSRRA